MAPRGCRKLSAGVVDPMMAVALGSSIGGVYQDKVQGCRTKIIVGGQNRNMTFVTRNDEKFLKYLETSVEPRVVLIAFRAYRAEFIRAVRDIHFVCTVAACGIGVILCSLFRGISTLSLGKKRKRNHSEKSFCCGVK